jgi:hypothetical protein
VVTIRGRGPVEKLGVGIDAVLSLRGVCRRELQTGRKGGVAAAEVAVHDKVLSVYRRSKSKQHGDSSEKYMRSLPNRRAQHHDFLLEIARKGMSALL